VGWDGQNDWVARPKGRAIIYANYCRTESEPDKYFAAEICLQGQGLIGCLAQEFWVGGRLAIDMAERICVRFFAAWK
jgi:hypothetical protein